MFNMILSTFFFTLMGVCVKYLQNIPSHETVFFRSLIIFFITIISLKMHRAPVSLLGNDRKRLLLRGLTGAIGLILYFLTIQKLPFAQAITLQYLSPIFTLLISSIFLKEGGNIWQWLALVISFMGVYFVQNMGAIDLSFYTGLGLLAAFCSGLSYTNIRVLNKTDHPLVIVFYFAAVTLVLISPYTLMHWVNPSGFELLILLLMGIAAQLGQYFLTLAYQGNKASSIAHLTYLNVLWALLIGEFIMKEHLSLLNIFGISLIISGTFISKIKLKIKRKKTTLVSLSFLLLCLSSQIAVAEPTQLVVAIKGEPTEGFDPILGWGRYGSPLFQSTLLKKNAKLQIVPDLALKWTLSPNRLVWTIQIRKDVKFSDGHPLRASDVVFSYNMAKKSGGKLDLTVMKEARTLDEDHLQIELIHPQITFLDTLSTLGIVPAHIYLKVKNYGRSPVGSGPFMFVSWEEGQHLKIKANPLYYGKKSSFKEITFLFSSEESSYTLAKTGQVQILAIPPLMAAHLNPIPNMKLLALPSVDNRGISFPMSKELNKVSSDLAIRRAINFALNREELVKSILGGFGVAAFGPADGLPWENKKSAFRDNNIQLAQKILEEASWKINKSSGLREKEGVPAKMKLIYPADDKTRQYMALAIKQQLARIGLLIEIEGMSFEMMKNYYNKELVLFGWGGHSPIEIYHLYHSSMYGKDFFNVGNYRNPRVDKSLEEAQGAVSFAQSLQSWQKAYFDFSVHGDAPWAWLVNLKHTYLVHKCLNLGASQIEPHDHGWPLTNNIEEWSWVKNCQ